MNANNSERRALPEEALFYSVNDLVAAGYGSRTSIWREIKSGELPAHKTKSGRVLILRDEFARYLDANKVEPSGSAKCTKNGTDNMQLIGD